jgi:hypothetical protein
MFIFIVVFLGCLFEEDQKRAKSEGKQCRVKTMMSRKVDKSLVV